MKNTELMPIEVSLSVPKKSRKKKKLIIDVKPADVLIRMLGLLFARAVPIYGMAPLGLSFLTLDRKFSIKSIINLIFVCAGYILLFDFNMAVRYIPACIIFQLVLFVMEYNTDVSLYFISAAAGAVLLVCETAALLWTGFTGAEFVLVLCDVTLMLAGIIVFDRTGELLLRRKSLNRPFVLDEKISLCIMAEIILVGTRSLTIADTFNIANFLACLVIALAAYGGHGYTAAAVCGVCVGIPIGLGGGFAETVAVCSICGLVCGAAAYFGRVGVSAALLACGGVFTLFAGIDIGAEHLPNIYEFAAAALAAYAIPETAPKVIGRIIDFAHDDNGKTERFKAFVTDKLMRMSDSFYELSRTFAEISDKQSNVDMSDVSLMFDTAADRVCKNCKKAGFCWQKDFNATYKTMFKFLEIMERKGGITLQDVPQCFNDKCVRLLPLITEINRLFEVYKINRVWKSRLAENRELTSEQFKGISEIIKNAADEISEEKTVDIIASDEIRDELDAIGVKTERVDVLRDKNQKYTVELSIIGCEDPKVCRTKVRSVIKNILGVNVVAPGMDCREVGRGKCRMRFCQVEGFDTVVGIASRSRSAESGDKHYTSYLNDGKFVVTISDGMGTGHKAAVESDAIVNLLGNFLEAGFDKTIAVKLVNSVMVMKSAHDAFATVDMCVIDLYTGQVEFIKNGAEASYIKHTDHTETVRAASLPIGIVSIVDIEAFARTLENGSVVVMTSDGVIGKNNDDLWLRELVESVDIDLKPDDLAQIILDEAIKRRGAADKAGNTLDDDMTVICVKMKDRRTPSARRIVKQPKAAVL